jgi:hypothetical protein
MNGRMATVGNGESEVKAPAILAVLGFCLLAAASVAAAQDRAGVDQQTRSRLSVLGDQGEAGEPPRVLHGSAIARMAPDPEPVAGLTRFSVLAGKRLWLTDPESGEVIACALYNTTDVGERVVRCYEGELPRSVAQD